jgi:hypothetical protein
MKQGINPITFVGHPPGQPENQRVVELRERGMSPHQTGEKLEGVRSISLGRLWIGSNKLTDTAHKFSPGSGHNSNWDRTFTLVIWEEADQPLGNAFCDENDFVRGYKSKSSSWEFVGAERNGSPLARYIRFEFTDDEVEISITNMDGELASSVAIDKEHFINGLQHLFPNGELLDPESN